MAQEGNALENVEETSSYYEKLPVAERHRMETQKFAIISIVSPDGLGDKCKDLAIRIYGCKPTLEEANKYAKELRDSNPYWNYYTMPTHEFAPLPPRIEDIEDVQYTSSRVQQIHDSYKIHLKGSAKDMAERLEMVDQMRQKDKAQKLLEDSAAPEAGAGLEGAAPEPSAGLEAAAPEAGAGGIDSGIVDVKEQVPVTPAEDGVEETKGE